MGPQHFFWTIHIAMSQFIAIVIPMAKMALIPTFAMAIATTCDIAIAFAITIAVCERALKGSFYDFLGYADISMVEDKIY